MTSEFNDSKFRETACVICRKGEDESAERVIKLRSDGRITLTRFSNVHCDVELSQYLSNDPPVVGVHKSCQLRFTKACDPKKQDLDQTPVKFLRSEVNKFDYKLCCFLCCQPVTERYREVQTSVIHGTMLQTCDKRKDAWAFDVLGRLQTCGDLRAADARYHIQCHLNFTTGRGVPSAPNLKSAGRPVVGAMMDIFNDVCQWMEDGDCELFTVGQLHDKMVELSNDRDNVYTVGYLKSLLLKRYGEHIWFASVPGRKDVICFRNMASRIVNDQWYCDRDKDLGKESERIVTAAAKLIKASIQDLKYNTEQYPVNSDISDRSTAKQWVPQLLRLFLEKLVTDEIKQISLGHSIVQASRPRSLLSPVLFGVGVSLDHVLASKWLLTLLSRLGFSITSEEVNRYKQSVVQTTDNDLPPNYPDCFTQWSGDNVDHNTVTLNGEGVFHGMGIISMSVPSSKPDAENLSGVFGESPIKRLPRVKVVTLTNGRTIPILHHTSPNVPPLSLLKLRPIKEIKDALITETSLNIDLIWQTGWWRNDNAPRPSWSGFMQTVFSGDLQLIFGCFQSLT